MLVPKRGAIERRGSGPVLCRTVNYADYQPLLQSPISHRTVSFVCPDFEHRVEFNKSDSKVTHQRSTVVILETEKENKHKSEEWGNVKRLSLDLRYTDNTLITCFW